MVKLLIPVAFVLLTVSVSAFYPLTSRAREAMFMATHQQYAVHPMSPPMMDATQHLSHEACICTREYNPICCLSSNGVFTASNPCTCACTGTPLYLGKCESCACPKIYRPVCCKTKFGQFVTASNACDCLTCTKGYISSFGACPKATTAPVPTAPSGFEPNPNCICPMIYAPVCCATPNGHATAPNSCSCTCKGLKVAFEGSC